MCQGIFPHPVEVKGFMYPRKYFLSYVYLRDLYKNLLVSAIFYQIFIFHQTVALQKLWKMFFISSKKLFLFSRYLSFCIFIFCSFSLSAIALEVDSGKVLKVYDVINCLNKNLITHFVWYLEEEIRCGTETLSINRELNKEHIYGKIMQKIYTKS